MAINVWIAEGVSKFALKRQFIPGYNQDRVFLLIKDRCFLALLSAWEAAEAEA
jgi:hypothetical protein